MATDREGGCAGFRSGGDGSQSHSFCSPQRACDIDFRTTITPTLKANYFALGSSSTAAANADTTLGTETIRAAFTDRSSYTNIAYLDVFFPSTSVGGNSYLEAGIFVDGTASANTGYLLSRVIINQTLGSAQTLTVNCSITIS